MKKLFINAVNINQGGGYNLLLALLEEVRFKNFVYAFLDERLTSHLYKYNKIKINFITPSLLARFINEINLLFKAKKNDTLLCFGNLPPLFKSQSQVIVFVQSRYLVDRISLNGFPLKEKIRILILRLWFNLKISNVDVFVVQTQSMKNLLTNKIKCVKPIYQIAFANNDYINSNFSKFPAKKNLSEGFVYVASGEPHKNHKNLIQAWCLLSKAGIFPNLTITLDSKKYKNLCSWINSKKNNFKINVTNVGFVNSVKIKNLYSKSEALIYPSKLESFGLPLIEAKAMNLKILAPELDYVRDLIDPDETFNPDSPVSIARSVRRFIHNPENRAPIKSAKQFLAELQIG